MSYYSNLQDSTSIHYSTDSLSSDTIELFDLSPTETVDDSYWFKDFANDVYNTSSEYLQNRTFFNGESKERLPGWLAIAFLCCFALTAFVRGFHRKRLNLITKTLLNWKFGKQIVRYEKVYTHPVNIALIINFLIATPLFFALCYNEFSQNLIGLFNLGLIFSIALILFGIAKLALYKFSGWVFHSSEEMREYIFHVNLIAKFLGIIFFILTIFLAYSPINHLLIWWTGISILYIAIGLQILRGTLIGLQKSKDLILIILYLCTLEILPLLVMGKLVLNEL